ncbi:MAG: LytR C-terminal domain-containing protein [Actinobacteria bacterium]|nr:LytR C-terminal domain-containing protein [Actinomycetota bacterium]MBV8961393.1 LytR C-terminal domain-containing protein [Actinomycetota bacterium]MBV9254815.1 LytR C-terminal domain-containing protein [Actinomycetota bacterium]MBV9663866.1 LytR C-terminal domain-containing protein [Actinomycetota bacterium]MBV9935296.1 LytR C-terminal domain-containing protein [Actinomycetota bacterium]
MSVGRGAILIAVAFVIGLILLQKTDRAPSTTVKTPTVTVTTSPNLTLPTTPTTLGGHTPSSVKVLVVNGTNTAGAASRVVPPLTQAGYNVLAPTDATKTAKSSTRQSVVYFTPGYDLDAKIIATRLTLQLTAVEALPATAPVANTQEANVLVLVGPDLAGASGGTTATTGRTTATTARTTATTARTTATTAHTSTTRLSVTPTTAKPAKPATTPTTHP